jgi:hypothetical protein
MIGARAKVAARLHGWLEPPFPHAIERRGIELWYGLNDAAPGNPTLDVNQDLDLHGALDALVEGALRVLGLRHA